LYIIKDLYITFIFKSATSIKGSCIKLARVGHTSYLSRTHGRCPWRKNLSCGEISNSCTLQMWKSLKFIHMWIDFKFLHMTDVETSEISFNMCTIYGILLHFKLFCCKICDFLSIFVAKLVCCDLRAFVRRKFQPKIVSVEKK